VIRRWLNLFSPGSVISPSRLLTAFCEPFIKPF
jgi:hypothetical protein